MGVKQTVLVVEDDVSLCELYREVLGTIDCQVELAHSGEDAVMKIASKKFDVILSDYKMPGMDGLQLIAVIKSNILNCHTPIVFISGALKEVGVEHLKKLGLAQVMGKPVKLEILLETVRDLLEPKFQIASYHPVTTDVFSTCLKEVLSDFIPKDLHWEAPEMNRSTETDLSFVGTVALFGASIYGSVSVACNRVFLTDMSKALFGDSAEMQADGFLESIIGELVNQYAGAIKAKMLNKGVDLVIGLPEVAHDALKIPVKVTNPGMWLRGDLGEGRVAGHFCLGNPKLLSQRPNSQHIEVFLYGQEKKSA